VSAIAGRVSRFSYRNLAISTVETSTPVGCRGAAPRRDAEGGEQNQNDGGRGWFVNFYYIRFFPYIKRRMSKTSKAGSPLGQVPALVLA